MIRQPTPADPALTIAVPPAPGQTIKVKRRARAAAAPTAVETEPAVVPEAARRGTVEVLPRALTDGDTVLWTPPVPTFTYLAGAAGSGKTFATKGWAAADKGLLLCATTGVAAINLGGETVNTVLSYFDTKSLDEKYRSGSLTAKLGKLWQSGVRRLVLDEVSMLSGDQLTCLVKAIEEVNGRGYVLGKWTEDDDSPPPAMGLTLVGDFLQLAPVKEPYAFESEEWPRFTDNVVTLSRIRRQDDGEFIEMLRAAREGNGVTVAEYFASREQIHTETDDHYDGPTIVATNATADRHNGLRLSRLKGKAVGFPSSRWGKPRGEWEHIPTELTLKIGALVMVLSNERDRSGQLLYVNGDLGTIVDAEKGTALVELQRTGDVVRVGPVTRAVRIPSDSARRKELREKGQADRVEGKWEIVGEVTYVPLRVAYASTVHKSQGLSLDKVQVNIRDYFFGMPGMMYVALSRARTAAGLRLIGSPQGIVDKCRSDRKLGAWL